MHCDPNNLNWNGRRHFNNITTKKVSKSSIDYPFCKGNTPGLDGFPSQSARNGESVPITMTYSWKSWGRNKMAAIMGTTYFNDIFLTGNVHILIHISLTFCPEVQFDIRPALIWIMALWHQATSFCLNQWWASSLGSFGCASLWRLWAKMR